MTATTEYPFAVGIWLVNGETLFFQATRVQVSNFRNDYAVYVSRGSNKVVSMATNARTYDIPLSSVLYYVVENWEPHEPKSLGFNVS
ncbi:hypothetical protein [Deinococcus sp.]|uniref:hypothetical protein n=1 Tax=Deinococcus sp. TaxID=47478 RepID=UPI003CC61839